MKTFVYIGLSLDGFIAGPNGELDWLTQFESNEIYEKYLVFINDIDAIVIGRSTFETVLTFPEWPYTKKAFVLSSRLKSLPSNLEDKAEILSLSPRQLLSKLERDGFSNIYVDGGKTIQNFLNDDCIDEMIITHLPILLGKGIPLFGVINHSISFTHLSTQTYPKGLVSSHYQRKSNREEVQ